MSDDRHPGGYILLVGAVLATAITYLGLVPRHFSTNPERAVLYLVVGWVPYTILFYLLGRLFSSPAALPSMRAADVGLGVALVALLLSLGLDAWGFTPAVVPVAHLFQAVAIYAGLALFGWGIGRRSKALTRRA
ncbi:hypothetical protein [Halopiger xanaduensis]|uniref:Uncharacterized protein n=1 Tax=Halopiger xanaduensis (strain DSM 18323 / JCM 14033 / SH-6) TaxID=797210 RepID=F8DE90_HALXS|nr:hypothetical protein [Halopiger xanaduensis]AEH39372.1 hypothetical protein Halxa_0128 [Halopiger xanaduensis SH-6]